MVARIYWKDFVLGHINPFRKNTKMTAHDAMEHVDMKFKDDLGSLTPQEYQILRKATVQGFSSMSNGAVIGASLAFTGTMWMGSFRGVFRKPISLSVILRAHIMIVSSRFGLEYARERSQEPFVLEILALDGGQLQQELVTTIREELGRSSSLMQLISRHFYEQRVPIDSSFDSAITRWRFRNDFRDYVLYGDNSDHP